MLKDYTFFLSPYFLGTWLKKKLSHKTCMPGPVISIGNIELGGTGKTPLVIKMVNYIKKKNYSVIVLSRGYKRKLKKPCIVSHNLSALECGDEPYMIFKNTGALVYVNKNRENILYHHIPQNPLFILDDGFQYFKIKKDLDIVIITKKTFKYSGHVIPFGYLREPIKALKRAHIIIVNFRFDTPIHQINEFMGKPTYPAMYTIDGIFDYHNTPIETPSHAVLLSAIAKNREFYEIMSAKLNIKILKHYTLLDHSYFPKKLLEKIIKQKIPIITTEKDYYRIPEEYKKYFSYLKISIKIEREEEFYKMVENKISHLS